MIADEQTAPADPAPAPRGTHAFPYNYQVSNSGPASGVANQSTDSLTLRVNDLDRNATDNSAFFATLLAGDTIVCNGVTWTIGSISTGIGTYIFGITPAVGAPPSGATSITFGEALPPGTRPEFPTFTTPVPPVASGQPPPPVFPPVSPATTPVPVPVGPFAAPEPVVPAAVPPSIAGKALITYKSGSAAAPAANGYFTQFTTVFPSPPIVITQSPGVFGIFNGAVVDAGKDPPWKWNPPPSTATTANITIDGYAPVWSGLSDFSVAATELEEPDAGAIHRGNSGPAKRRRRSVLSAADPN